MPMEVQTELLEADSDQVTAAIMTQEMEPSQDATAETARENRRDAEEPCAPPSTPSGWPSHRPAWAWPAPPARRLTGAGS